MGWIVGRGGGGGSSGGMLSSPLQLVVLVQGEVVLARGDVNGDTSKSKYSYNNRINNHE